MGDNPAHRADDGGRESGYLDSEEAIAEYLSLAARDENPGEKGSQVESGVGGERGCETQSLRLFQQLLRFA
jgi:hypothetical protein